MAFISGVCIGILVFAIIVYFAFPAGTLRVYIPDQQDEQPYLYVDLDKTVSSVCKGKLVVFKVDVRNLNTQK